MEKEQFVFEKRRKFGDLVGDTIKFFVNNLASMTTGFLIYVGPFVVLSLLFGSFSFDQIRSFDEDLGEFAIDISITFFFTWLTGLAVYSYTYAVVQKFREYPDEPILERLWPYIRSIAVRIVAVVLSISVFFVLILSAMGLLAYLAGTVGAVIVILISLPFLVYLVIPLLLAPYVYVNEQITIFESFERAFKLVRGSWWETFGFILIISLIVSTISSIIVYPAYISSFLEGLSSSDPATAFDDVSLFMRISVALSTLVSFYLSIVQALGYALQYFNLREKKEGTSLLERIESIDSDAH